MVLLLSVLLIKFAFCDGANILFLAITPLHSHQTALRPVYMELARRGHQMTVVSCLQPNEVHESITHIYLKQTLHGLSRFLEADMKGADTLKSQQTRTFNTAKVILESILKDDMRELIKSGRKFDLIITEACVRFSTVFSEVFQSPMVLISTLGGSFDTFRMVSSPEQPILYPIGIRKRFTNLTEMEKVVETYRHFDLLKLYYDMGEFDEEVVRKYLGDDFPSIHEINNNIELIMLNLHPLWDSNRPVPSNVIYLGGLQLQEHKELSQDLHTILDESERVIFMSFGSSVRSSILNRMKIDMFLKVLSELPYTVMWKWDTEVENLPKNIIVRKWFPQRDLLRHPKIKLFITQGGLQSVDESIDARVPMVGVPILWDQFYNVHKIAELQIGVMCDVQTVSEEQFRNAVVDVLTDKRYRININKLRNVMNEKRQSSLEKAIWWIEYVAQHKGAKHLRSPAFNMSIREYYELDLVLSVILLVIILMFLVIRFIKYCCVLCIGVRRDTKVRLD
ncbi:unnamed protein product [Pieris macdunnoughi]|uniref:UDP-glucuronosyltransferase n=1 Tax=Pieris macdunnoughi TaxID=345717 RepID=A0A821UL46_9NEOP|nr:unnamed protein product [Pieris macdunnoughi]